MKSKLLIFFIFTFAFVLRLFLAEFYLNPKLEINGDIKRYRELAIITNQAGISETYPPNHSKFGISPNNQPFGTAYTYSGVYNAYSSIVKSKFTQKEVFANFLFIIKFVSVFADMLIGVFLYVVIYKETKKRGPGLIASALFLFNPVVLYNSAVWGQTDAINNLLFVSSIYLLYKNKPRMSVFLYLLSLVFKLSLLPLLPLYIALHFTLIPKNRIKNLLFSGLFGVACLYLITLSTSNNPFEWWKNYLIINSQGELPYISVYTFNFWWMIFQPKFLLDIPSSEAIFLWIRLRYWAYIVYVLLLIPILIKLFIHRLKKPHFLPTVNFVFCSEFIMFLFLPRMHERYLYPAILTMILFIALKGLRWWDIFLFVIVSLINFLNLYIVWHPIYIFPILFEGLIAHWKVRFIMSLVLTLIGSYYFMNLFHKESISKK